MEGFSFKKTDSPDNFVNEAYASQQSISKVSKTSLKIFNQLNQANN